MTKEKLKKEAEESAEKFFGKSTDLVDLDNLRIFKNGYLAGAEPREIEMEMQEKEMQILFSRLADRGRRIQIFEQRIEQLEKDIIENESDCANCGLRKENAELKEKWNTLDKSLVTSTKNNIERQKIIDGLKEKNVVLERRIERAKECMRKLLFIINSDPANYNCKGLIQDAEDFIYNRTCNIRLQGEHCIPETRCIMCDKGDKND